MTFFKGMAIGISIAAPVGPIALLCLRRSLTDGRIVGFVSGLGAATADALCGAVAAFGLSALVGLVHRFNTTLQAGGGVFMLVLGGCFIRTPSVRADFSPSHARNLGVAFGSTLLLTLANPMTLLSFLGVAATLGPKAVGTTRWMAGQFVLGVFVGSSLWWLFWSGAAGRFREHIGSQMLRWINRVAGVGIAIFGAVQLLRLALGAV
jgi:threonine/homoserine/homoserine lactone efflux protein